MNALAHLMTETISIKTRSGATTYGDPTFNAVSTMSARVERKARKLRDMDGNEWETSHVIASLEEIPLGTMIWFAGADTSDDNEGYIVASPGNALAISDGSTLYETHLRSAL